MDPFSASVETGVNFLAKLYQTGVGYSAINSARCALSTCILIGGCKSFGSHPLVCRFIKGFFESRPSQLFAGHLVGSKPMKRNKNWSRMIMTLSSSSKLKNK